MSRFWAPFCGASQGRKLLCLVSNMQNDLFFETQNSSKPNLLASNILNSKYCFYWPLLYVPACTCVSNLLVKFPMVCPLFSYVSSGYSFLARDKGQIILTSSFNSFFFLFFNYKILWNVSLPTSRTVLYLLYDSLLPYYRCSIFA